MGFWSKLFGKKENNNEPQITEELNDLVDDAENIADVSEETDSVSTENEVTEIEDTEIEDIEIQDQSMEQEDSEETSTEESEKLLENSASSEPSVESNVPEEIVSEEAAEISNQPTPALPKVGKTSSSMPLPGRVKPISGQSQTSSAVLPPVPPDLPKNQSLSGDGDDPDDGKGEEEDSSDSSDHLEDLSILDGDLLPQLVVPSWQDELKFVKERYEPCDLTDHIVKVSKRRLTSRRIDYELAKSRLGAYERYLERASRRFKDKIDEDILLKQSREDLYQWRGQQTKSVAWRLAERINEEVLKAKAAEEEATAFVAENNTFSNPDAIKVYRHMVRRVFLIPVVTSYIGSVVALTYFKFDWILKFLPFFNLGIRSTLIMIAGVASGFLLNNLWKYSKSVSLTQKQLVNFNDRYQDQYNKIRHAVKEHTRLVQQQPGVEPRLRVLAKAYRVQLQSDVSIKAHATTSFDPASLPACVTLARAVDNDDMKMAKLKRQALRVLMRPGWRTNGLDQIAKIHADSKMLDSNTISLRSLDTDSVVSATNAQKVLLEAFSNVGIHDRISKSRLVEAIRDLHKEVLAKWESEDRPEVASLRYEGFNKLSFRSSWLEDENVNENWINFLTEILSDDTAPFSAFNIQDKRSKLNDESAISSVAVVPHYFKIERDKVKVENSTVEDLTPLDVVVRVDVSPWSEPSAFAVFADAISTQTEDQSGEDYLSGGGTSA